jgi:hypothetical protein
MIAKHFSEETITSIPTSKTRRGGNISRLETKVSDVIANAPTISSVSNIGTTAYITASYSQNALGGIPTSYTATSSPGGISTTVKSLSRPIIITGLSANTTYTFTVSANNVVSSTSSSASSSITTTISTFSSGSNQSAADLHTLLTTMANGTTTSTPTAGGTLTINSASLGSYDYVIKRGNQTISSFTNSDWFTTTADTRSALIVVDGDLTINHGQRLIPSNRKLFTAIYVTGDLNLHGDISMTDRGANHSATAAAAIRLHTGTFSGVTNPQVPAAGGAGAPTVSRVGPPTGSTTGASGTAGTAGGTGGGGGGGAYCAGDATGSTCIGGAGSAGTSFTGGGGGGPVMVYSGSSTGGNAAPNGGKGGNAGPCYSYGGGGGAGNPGGDSMIQATQTTSAGWEIYGGTAGVLAIFVKGTFKGNSGTINAQGHSTHEYSYPYYMQMPGGNGGGGSITVFYAYDDSNITPDASAGARGPSAGAGGAGTARKLSLV